MLGFAYAKFSRSDRYFYTRALVGDALSWARASAACLNLNCTMVLLPTCRHLMSRVRAACWHCRPAIRRQMDHCGYFHRTIAYTIVLLTAVHVVAHILGSERFYAASRAHDNSLHARLSALGTNHNETRLNPVWRANTSPLRESLSGVPGASGMLMTTCLVLIATSSRESVRRANYEIFWFTHLLAPVLYAGLLVHGLGRVVRGQTEASLQEHNITWCYARHEQWGGREAACPTPQFSGNPPMTWRWLLLPLLLYAGEQLLRCYCCCHPTVVTKVTSFPLVPRAPALQKHSCHTSHDTPHVVPVRSAGGLYTHTLCCAGVMHVQCAGVMYLCCTGVMYLCCTGVLYLCCAGVMYLCCTGMLYLCCTGALCLCCTGVMYLCCTGVMYVYFAGVLYLCCTGVLYLCCTGVLYLCCTGVMYLCCAGVLYLCCTGVLYLCCTGVMYLCCAGVLCLCCTGVRYLYCTDVMYLCCTGVMYVYFAGVLYLCCTGMLYLCCTGVLYLCCTGVLYLCCTGVLCLCCTGVLYLCCTGVLYLCCTGVLYLCLQVREHPGHVLEVRVLGCPARARPGDHVLVRCASVSRAQWHALTLTWQNPPRTQMPIPVLGCQPWAGWPTVITAAHGLSAWWDSCHARRLTPCTPHPAWPRLCVDGPFVGPSRDVDRYPVSVLIAAGIGITPFAAYLGSWLTGAPRHTTVYLYWICREPSSFAWLCEPLRSLERHLMETGSSHQLRYKLYLTRWDETQAVHIALHWDEAEDTITGLRQKTWFGRPNWSVELDQIARTHPGVEVGVFACGPRSLCEGVRRRCSRYCSAGPDGAAFRFHQEAD
ncbi:NADPH oxidase 3-like [Petromyzon marinus]|uniref:NADPH oxidase 3-like n=1 Tax=Petromyzon marinus TaxID=7757 RepID=UPI003F6FC649